MEAIQQSVQALTEHFNTQMAEFQKNLQGAIPAASPTSNIAAQFNAFRTFVLSALSGLQQQVEVLAKQMDQLEMRSRKKMLLVHGIPESDDSNLAATVSTSLSDHLKLSAFQEDCLSRCQRIGQPKSDKPRAILLKFHDLSMRNQVWFAKTSLKNTGITLSEFLTKDRHDAFMAARQKFGISKCWTRDGLIIIAGQANKRYRVTTITEVNSISQARADEEATPSAAAPTAKPTSNVNKPSFNAPSRAKRITKK
ncbi:uncharacterized protein LOC123878896 [Maniola jurtina]|uniref:uncharacterized protein LOC123866609 n=1 Tax=Maniola jurtina TaxID=191418 RepID=UPI001E68FB23|nr:uncharacterized protein LOC123866609 [Maniola jurtina]XP_045765389.1 uncharacterized protein LOC123867423 [Maniola jurtina]XP_045782229.1 uncharacterized protein LOC123878896 [Maniola jurtina]